MNLRTILVSWLVLCVLAAADAAAQTAAAQRLALRIDQGLVTLDADNVTVEDVLARWIKTTGLNVVSTTGQGSNIPVSLHVRGISERDALKMVLRDVSGYIIGERVEDGTGAVRIDRLVILTESAPRAPDARPAGLRPLARPTAGEDQVPMELAPQVERSERSLEP